MRTILLGWLNDNSAAQEFYPLKSAKINKNQLYSASNILYEHKDKIENYLNQSIEKIFNLKRKIVLYDLTNTHFEGAMAGARKQLLAEINKSVMIVAK